MVPGRASQTIASSQIWGCSTHAQFLNSLSSYLCWISYSTAHRSGCRLLPAKHHHTDVVNQSLQHLLCTQRKSESSYRKFFYAKYCPCWSLTTQHQLQASLRRSQEEFCSQKRELCRGLLCTVTCHEGL